MTELDDRNLPDLDAIPHKPDPLPGLREIVNPILGYQWTWSFVHSWFLSRDYSRAWRMLPILLLVIIGIVGYFENDASPESLVFTYRAAVDQALDRDDRETALLYAKALEAIRPEDMDIKFRIALLQEEDNPEECVARMVELAPEQEPGFAPARIWIVRQARRPDPLLPLTATQIRNQLLQVLNSAPDNREAKALLAESYLQASEWLLAEQQLTPLVHGHPELSLAMAKVKQMLNREEGAIRRFLSDAEAFYRDQVAEHPDNLAAWVALSETLVLRGQVAEARNILITEIERKDDPGLRRRVSDLDLAQAATLAKTSPLNFDQSLVHCLEALRIDPGNPAILPLIVSLRERGLQVPTTQLVDAKNWWLGRLSESPENMEIRLICAQYLAFCGEPGEAANLLEPVLEARPDLQLPQVELLRSAGRTEVAAELLQKVIDQSRRKYEASESDRKELAQLCQALLLAGQSEEVKSLLKDYRTASENSGSESIKLQVLYGKACVALFDKKFHDLQSANIDAWTEGETEGLLNLLSEGLAVPSSSVPSLQRLASMAFSKFPSAAKAKDLIQRLRLSGSGNSEVLSLVGVMAYMAGEYSEAVGFLQLASASANGNDPAILNNLAMAKLKRGDSELSEVLALVDSALQKIPKNPDFLATRAEVYIAMKRWPDALADLQAALPSRTGNASLHSLLSIVFKELGDPVMAEEHAGRAKELEARKE